VTDPTPINMYYDSLYLSLYLLITNKVHVRRSRTSPTGYSWERIRLFPRRRLVTCGLTRMYYGMYVSGIDTSDVHTSFLVPTLETVSRSLQTVLDGRVLVLETVSCFMDVFIFVKSSSSVFMEVGS